MFQSPENAQKVFAFRIFYNIYKTLHAIHSHPDSHSDSYDAVFVAVAVFDVPLIQNSMHCNALQCIAMQL